MVVDAHNPEDDISDVVAELARLYDGGQKDVLLDAVKHVLSAAKAENRYLSMRVVELTKQVYGRSSERINPNQLKLALADMRRDTHPFEAPPDGELPTEIPNPPKSKTRNKRKGGGRRQLPAHLPREEVRLIPTADQIDGKGIMSKVGEERSEVLEYEPARFKVLVYVRETWSSMAGEIVTAPPANKVIDKGLPGPGLLSEIAVSKYLDHVPLARKSRIMARDGVDIHRNTLVDWIAAVAMLLEPLACRICELALLAHALQVDDTRIDVLDKSKARNIKRGHLWVLVGDRKYIAFRYTPNWTAKLASEFLGGRIGWMQVDGYKGFEVLARDSLMLLVGCWMHARRYFVKAFDSGDIRAAEPLHIIKLMYKIEAASKAADESHDQRFERRQCDLRPLLDELEQWLSNSDNVAAPKSPLGRAIRYAQNHWDILRVVEKDGALELDNGDVERIIRGPATGRKNWLFAGSDNGGERAATILTVLETAKRAGLDPRAYLRDVLVKLSGGWLNSRLDELLPENWAPGE